MGLIDRLMGMVRWQTATPQSAPTSIMPSGVTNMMVPIADTTGQRDGVVARIVSAIKRLSGAPAYGKFAGFLEPNSEVTPTDLYGLTNRELGILYRMRWAHPVISSGMDFAQRAIEAVEYGLEPANGTLEAIAARNAVEREILETPGFTLSSFVGQVFDLTRTYGFAALETISPDGRHIAPRMIAPYLIQWWNYAPDFIDLASVTVTSGASMRTLDVDAFSWYGRQAAPGHWYGISDLRKLLALFAAYEQDLRTYLDQQRLARGILYGQEQEGLTNQTSVDRMIEWLIRYHRGEDFPLIAPAGVKPAVISVVNPSLSHFKDMLGYYDTAFREALMSSLGSLGINGEGARSLGESFRVVDAQRLKAALDAFLREINGETCSRSNFMQLLTINAGFDASLTPRIVCAGQIGVDMTQQRTDLVLMVNAGLVTREDLGQDNIDRIIEGMGFEIPDRAPVSPTVMPSADIASVSHSAQAPPALLQTRARRMPVAVVNRIFDGLLRHEATADVTIAEPLLASARSWVRGQVPTDDEVLGAMRWLTSAEGRAAMTARAGQPEWLLAQVYGGRAGAGYWQGEYNRRGLQVAQ